MNTIKKEWNISTVKKKVESLQYDLELAQASDTIIDSETVDVILHHLSQVKTAITPFKGGENFSVTLEEDYTSYVDSILRLGNLFIEDPTLSVDTMKSEITSNKDIVNLLPYLESYTKTNKED